MAGAYDQRLVALSVVVAILASYTALDVVGRMGERRDWRCYGWLAGGALALGAGVWAMHFVGMIAFRLPLDMGYDVDITSASWLMAVVACAFALNAVTHARLTRARLVVGASAMAAGIGGMHYTGMFAMRLHPGIEYTPILVGVSLLIAFAASAVALRIASFLRQAQAGSRFGRKFLAALALGVAIAGMHYTGMAAAHFRVDSLFGASAELDTLWLGTLVGASTVIFLAIALIVSILDRRLENSTSDLVASLSRANAELLHMSRHDPLTGLPNRALLNERIDKSLERWKSQGVGFAIAYIDLDGFKAINDHLGHRAGDKLLEQIALVLRDALTDGDVAARIGGDEFVVLMNDIADKDDARAVCTRMLKAISQVEYAGGELAASVGYALCPNDGADLDALITAADMAMYGGKLAGKNRVQRYREDMGARMSDDFALQSELRDAIRYGGLAVYFQPRFRSGDRRLVGAEALVRWPHPTRGFISPDRFIAIAERCGLITELEINVLDMVGGHIRGWLNDGLVVPPISVNLSAVRIRDESLPDQVQGCLERYRLDPAYISFEITESLAVREIAQARSALGRFKSMGIEVALDDFGTGYSSLFYLKQLPIQQLKIDRSFIADLPNISEPKAEIVEWIIRLSHQLQLRVVAEGVETEAQLAYLQRIGCDEVQGFLLSRPLPADRLLALLEREHGPIRASGPMR